MSHFCILVIGDDVEGQLQPYHEFECTGYDDEYVQQIDQLAEARAEYRGHTENYPTFAQFVEAWYGRERVEPGEEPDLGSVHKFGWYRVDGDGEVIEVINRTNPQRKWDYWRIGGRWGDFFLLKQGAEGTRGELAWERTFNEKDRAELAVQRAEEIAIGREHADQAKKGDIDWEGMAAEAMRDARRSYAKFLEEAGRGRNLGLATYLYGVRYKPEVQATWDALIKRGGVTEEERTAWRQARTLADVETEDEYANRQAQGSGVTFAVVKDGVWYEKGRMGWFAAVSDEMDEKEWDQRYWAMLADLPDDTLLTCVDAHI